MVKNNNNFFIKDSDIDYFYEDRDFDKNIHMKFFVKLNGKIWTFHKNDEDPWPSIPHGHCGVEKLNPFTGKIYDVRTRECIGRVKKQALRKLQKDLLASKDFKHLCF